jgi:hypothetical protein
MTLGFILQQQKCVQQQEFEQLSSSSPPVERRSIQHTPGRRRGRSRITVFHVQNRAHQIDDRCKNIRGQRLVNRRKVAGIAKLA